MFRMQNILPIIIIIVCCYCLGSTSNSRKLNNLEIQYDLVYSLF